MSAYYWLLLTTFCVTWFVASISGQAVGRWIGRAQERKRIVSDLRRRAAVAGFFTTERHWLILLADGIESRGGSPDAGTTEP